MHWRLIGRVELTSTICDSESSMVFPMESDLLALGMVE